MTEREPRENDALDDEVPWELRGDPGDDQAARGPGVNNRPSRMQRLRNWIYGTGENRKGASGLYNAGRIELTGHVDDPLPFDSGPIEYQDRAARRATRRRT